MTANQDPNRPCERCGANAFNGAGDMRWHYDVQSSRADDQCTRPAKAEPRGPITTEFSSESIKVFLPCERCGEPILENKKHRNQRLDDYCYKRPQQPEPSDRHGPCPGCGEDVPLGVLPPSSSLGPLTDEEIDRYDAGFRGGASTRNWVKDERMMATIRALQDKLKSTNEKGLEWMDRAIIAENRDVDHLKRAEVAEAELAVVMEWIEGIKADFPGLEQSNGQKADWDWIDEWRPCPLANLPATDKILVDG